LTPVVYGVATLRWRRAANAIINIGRHTWQAYCHAVQETAAATYSGGSKVWRRARELSHLPACHYYFLVTVLVWDIVSYKYSLNVIKSWLVNEVVICSEIENCFLMFLW